ncbi:uncharacterized protein EAF01_005901 [Botrytis porri]|uniref:Uncharacterized protein n=1 Tax=Botrytis porri TaxID=87229 RepID=A0A4Z1L647_9HELO|nr:uncharacterized protein EAF01_005901 [Botrytis porri]KAF7905380.1 hypothetical protein EAF01_005901 [Botrytis porri]TGO92324.1 hypothetical protein BPOR_0005g00130 [Botrytis porri]
MDPIKENFQGTPTPHPPGGNNAMLKRLRGSGSSGRNRPGSRARYAHQNDGTPTAPARHQTPSTNDFPPLGFNAMQDGSVFGNVSGSTTIRPSITGILARPTGGTNAREGNNLGGGIGMGMNQQAINRRVLRAKSISANYSVPTGEFMGGKKGEMSQDGAEISSSTGPHQFSRRGNQVPARSDASGTSTRTNRVVAAYQAANSAPNPLAMAQAAGTSLTHRSDAYEVGKNFDRLRIQGNHLGLTTSLYFPKSTEDLVKHREERKNDARDEMNERIRNKEEVMRMKSEGTYVKVKPAFRGRAFSDELSTVLARNTIWGHPSMDEESTVRADWPTLADLKQAGMRKAGLPSPKYNAGYDNGMAGEEVASFAIDRVGSRGRRADEDAVIEEEEIMEIGGMKTLFDAIDG